MSLDLFGDPPPRKNKGPTAKGYAYFPGTGPDGETCGTCRHCFKKTYIARPSFKCLLMRGTWTRTRKTDILVRSKACKKWEAKEVEDGISPR